MRASPRRFWVALIAVQAVAMLASDAALAAGYSEGLSPDLSGYKVTDRDASFFDVAGCMK